MFKHTVPKTAKISVKNEADFLSPKAIFETNEDDFLLALPYHDRNPFLYKYVDQENKNFLVTSIGL